MSSTCRRSPLDARLHAKLHDFIASRPPEADEDVHMLPAIVDHVIERCSALGELVFDPFAGFGTTLERAIALGRRALGVELLPERVEFVRARLPAATVHEGDARELLRVLERHRSPAARSAVGEWCVAPGSVDLVLTSPPYMTEHDHAADPLTAYELDTGHYGRYLAELSLVAAQCARLVKRGGYVVWNVADIHHRGHTTRLIDDCARVLAQHLSHVGTTQIEWDEYPHDLVADALLVYRRE